MSKANKSLSFKKIKKIYHESHTPEPQLEEEIQVVEVLPEPVQETIEEVIQPELEPVKVVQGNEALIDEFLAAIGAKDLVEIVVTPPPKKLNIAPSAFVDTAKLDEFLKSIEEESIVEVKVPAPAQIVEDKPLPPIKSQIDLTKPVVSSKKPKVTIDPNIKALQDRLNIFEKRLTDLSMVPGQDPGGGETKLRFLDDVDRDTIVDGWFLRYNQTTEKFEFASPSAASFNETDIRAVYAEVKNGDTVTIHKGDPVYLYRATGNKASVILAGSTSDSVSAKTLGLAYNTFAPGATGLVITKGTLTGIDTSMFSEGDTVYLAPTAGTLTNVKPHSPQHLVYIGVVERANQGQGQIYVSPQNGYELDELHNVNIDHLVELQDGHILLWSEADNQWVNGPAPQGFSGSYNDLTNKPTLFSGSYNDLTNKPSIPSLSGYATETYVSTAINNLINSAPGTLDTLGEIATALQSDESAIGALTSAITSKIDLTDLSVTTNAASGNGSLSYDNTNGVFTFTPAEGFSGSYNDLTNKPTLFSGSYTDLTDKPSLFSGSYNDLTNKPSIPTSINDLSDVNAPSPSNGQVLKWNATLGHWEPGADQTGAGGSGIALSDLSAAVDDTPSGNGSLSYNNMSGVFTYTPPVLFSGSYTDLTNKPTLFSGSYTDLTDKPTIPSLTGYATESYVGTAISNLINGAPGTLDTLKEIADQLASDESAVSALTTTVAGKIGLTNLSVSTSTASSGGSLSYNNTTGVFTFRPADLSTKIGLTNLSVSSASASGGGSLSYNNTTGVFTFTPPDFSSKIALTNLSVSTAAASGGGSLSYNNSTGVFTYTPVDLSTYVTSSSSPSFTNVTVTGQLFVQQIAEDFQTYSTTISGTPTVALDCSSGQMLNVTSATISSNFVINATNLGLTAGKASNVTVVVNQGSTAYIISGFQIGGSSQTINWLGGTTPTGNASKKDIFAFSILCTASNTYTVFGQLVSFG